MYVRYTIEDYGYYVTYDTFFDAQLAIFHPIQNNNTEILTMILYQAR